MFTRVLRDIILSGCELCVTRDLTECVIMTFQLYQYPARNNKKYNAYRKICVLLEFLIYIYKYLIILKIL